MHVLFVNPAAGLGGSERSLLDVLAALGSAAPRLERTLVLLQDGELGERARALGVRVERLPLPPRLRGLGEWRREEAAWRGALGAAGALSDVLGFAAAFRGVLRRARPDLIHTNGIKAHLLAAAAAPEARRIVHFRDFASERPLTRRLLPLLGLRAIFVANSRAVADDVRRHAPTRRTRVVYNAIDTHEFRPEGPAADLSELAGLEPAAPGAVNVGLVATFAWWKGHARFLEAAAKVRAALPGRAVRFYVVGGPIYGTRGSELGSDDLRRLVLELGLEGVAGLVPFQPDAAAVYRGLDVVVHASERPEPFGRTIVEAMASGRAVVVAREGGAAELFTERRDALGFRPRDAGDLARAVGELIENPALRNELGAAARATAVARFDRSRLGPELLEVYGELVGRRVD